MSYFCRWIQELTNQRDETHSWVFTKLLDIHNESSKTRVLTISNIAINIKHPKLKINSIICGTWHWNKCYFFRNSDDMFRNLMWQIREINGMYVRGYCLKEDVVYDSLSSGSATSTFSIATSIILREKIGKMLPCFIYLLNTRSIFYIVEIINN